MKYFVRGASAAVLLFAVPAQAQAPSQATGMAQSAQERQMPATTQGYLGQGYPALGAVLLAAPTPQARAVRVLSPSERLDMLDYVESRTATRNSRDPWELWWLVRTASNERGWINAAQLRVQ